MKKLTQVLIATSILATSLFSDVVWLEEADTRMKWEEAKKYCEDRDAILPAKKVFQKIWFENNKASDVAGFDLSVSYWTGDEVEGNKHAAYPFYFMDGRDTWYYKADRYGVRCIKKSK